MIHFFKNNFDSLEIIEQKNCIRVFAVNSYESQENKYEYRITFMPDMDMMSKKGVTIPEFNMLHRFSITILLDEILTVDELQKRINYEWRDNSNGLSIFNRFTSIGEPFSNHKSFINYNKSEE